MRIPTCSVSWTCLKKLSLRKCRLSDEYMAKILSGCPILESLKLCFCDALEVLDLSKSMRLRTLEVERNHWTLGPTQIVAPYIHCLILTSSQVSPCTLVDVSSLAEAKLNIVVCPYERTTKADFLQDMVLKMLAKLQNVEKLAFGEIFIQVLSLAELRGVSFPMFKVKALALKTSISQNVIHGIERILQNSPDLKTLKLHIRNGNTIPEVNLDEYVASQGMNPDPCWRSKDGTYWNRSRCDVEPKHVVSFMKRMVKTTKTLEKMVVKLEDTYGKFKELVSKTLSRNKNVSIVLSTMPMSCES
ncbi:Leucine-rich repeat 2 [Arabidopsis thaliana x Arabidopsis arenosa]|uniref:Leucine-rich repeat 2 n=1 Tax=Arabidopsis thaliana x Arabidopsis arenosa TaxID=1240361 RepID=A0A8T2AU86_9BRAS|nr:Leucine-rich repeat 2 [Arabidopsis thaliana x Arabidopsis arenosa]